MGLPIATMLIPTPAGTTGQAGATPAGIAGIGGAPGIAAGLAGQLFPNLLLTGLTPGLMQDMSLAANSSTSLQNPQEDIQTLLALYQPGQFAQDGKAGTVPQPGVAASDAQIVSFGQSNLVVTAAAEPEVVVPVAEADALPVEETAAPAEDTVERFLKLVSAAVSGTPADTAEAAPADVAALPKQNAVATPSITVANNVPAEPDEFALVADAELPEATPDEKPMMKVVQVQQQTVQTSVTPAVLDIKPEGEKRDTKSEKSKPSLLTSTTDGLLSNIQQNGRPVAAIVNDALAQRNLSGVNTAKDSGVQDAVMKPIDLATSIITNQSLYGADAAKPHSHAMEAQFSKLMQSSAHHPPVFDQVVVHIKNAVEQGASKISITLEPAELGKVEIRMEVMADGKTGLFVTADNKDALDLLQRDARSLSQALNDAGLKSDSGSMSFNLRQDHQQQQAQGDGSVLPAYGALGDNNETVMPAVQYMLSVTSGLDIMV